MSVRKLTARVVGSLIVLCGLATASAQDRLPTADPFEFNPDFRWFEPIYQADLDDITPKKRANTGWFGTYDRMRLWGSRPEVNANAAFNNQIGESNLDEGDGHRYEIGYMLPDQNSGFLFSWVNNDIYGVQINRHLALNLVNDDELGGDATNPGPPFGFEAIPGISNNASHNFRFFDEIDGHNVVEFDSYELSKTWRLEPQHYGGILEPLIGFRWFRIQDTAIQQAFTSSRTLVGGVPLLVAQLGASADQLTTDINETMNDAVAAQFGFRYTKFRDRFIFSSDMRFFTGANFQNSRSSKHTHQTLYTGTGQFPGQGSDIQMIINTQTNWTYDRNEELFLGFDARGELGYQLTKAITIRGGFQMINVARGLWRGGNANGALTAGDRDQDLQLLGGTFGITLNR